MDLNEMAFYRNKKKEMCSALVKANKQLLENQMQSNETLKNLLMKPASELPEKYTYLLAEVFEGWKDTTLWHLIEETFRKIPSDQIFFSMAGNEIVGWCAYTTKRDPKSGTIYVDEIKMFSFDINRPNPVLLRDLESLIKDLLEKYSMVSWVAVKENPANRIYQKAIEKYNGSKSEFGNLVQYSIEGA